MEILLHVTRNLELVSFSQCEPIIALHELEAFIGKASKGEDVAFLLRTLSNAAYGSFRLALWVKFDGKKRQQSFLPIGL